MSEEKPESKTASVPKAYGRSSVAVALGSQRRSDLPKVLASGKGELARSIIERAKEQGLSIKKDADLAQVLAHLDLGESIPEEVYMAVAEILYYLYEVNSRYREKVDQSTD